MEKQRDRYLPQRLEVRQELGFNETHTIFIFSGKLIPKKDPLTLARALQALPESRRQSVGLIVMGDGMLRPAFEAECRKALGHRVVFTGFVNQSHIGRYYTAADCLVLPSAWGETWGVVVNEAMQFGLPAIVSDRVGCHPDLVVEGQTGYVFPVGDLCKLRDCMLKTIDMLRGCREAVARRCRQQVSRYSSQEAVDGILRAVLSL